jgi:hypothetical protein
MSDSDRIERLEAAMLELLELLSLEDALQPWVVRRLADIAANIAQKAP